MPESGEGLSPDTLPSISKESGLTVFDPKDSLVQEWLKDQWEWGYNPLAAAGHPKSTAMRITLPDGSTYDYNDPSHAYKYYRQNKFDQEGSDRPNFLVHITQSGWVEYAIRENGGMIGKSDGTWTGSHDPHRWWGGAFPEGYQFEQPEQRFIELMFDAKSLREAGYEPKLVPNSDYFVFISKLPLQHLVPSSKAYLSQVMNLEVPQANGSTAGTQAEASAA